MAKSHRLVLGLVVAVSCIGSGVSMYVYRFTRAIERAQLDEAFGRRAEMRIALSRQIFDYYGTAVYVLKSLFEGSESVSREEFHRISADLLKRYPGITALEWVPIIPARERATTEARVSAEMGQPYQFTEPSAEGQMVRAHERATYLPIYYVEPMAGNERAFGYDLSNAPSGPFIERAWRERGFVLSTQFSLVQGNSGVVMIWPVSEPLSPGDAPRWRGAVQGVFRVQELLAQTHLRSPTTALDMMYLDDSATDPRDRVLYTWLGDRSSEAAANLTEADFRVGLHREYPIEIGGRRWVAIYRPTATWLAEQSTSVPEWSLAFGLLMTAMLVGVLATLAFSNARTRHEVAERTAELSESRRQLSNLLHALPGMACRCVRVNGRLRVVFLSEGALALTGYAPDDFLSGKLLFANIVHPDDLDGVRKAMYGAVERLDDVEFECRILALGGYEKWALVRGRGVAHPKDGTVWFEGLAIDVTARKQAEVDKISIERKLLESQKLESLGLLAGGIAHDFNNLLTGIIGHANLCRLHHELPPEVQEHLRHVESGAARAADLCQQMLAYSGRSRFVLEPVDLSQLVRDTLPLLQSTLVRARVELTLSEVPVFAIGDPTQLRQVLMNLVINAADSLPAEGGRIAIRTRLQSVDAAFLATSRLGDERQPGVYAVVEVEDEGCGMDAATLAKIFDPFFTTKFTGRGLGLAAVLGIVRSHGGALHVASAAEHGSKFTLALPPTNGESASVPSGGSGAPWARSGRALIIDDEPAVREVAAQMLRSFGMSTDAAADGSDGLRLFRTDPTGYDVVLLDLTMPGIDGMETLQHLREISPQIRVLLVSGYSETEKMAQLKAYSAVGFLPKPFTRSKLGEKLRAILG